ncbi:MAG: hypothetical protein ACRC8Z_03650 [Empedobacter falsenii]
MRVKEAIDNNIELFYKLDRLGIKNLSTAIDYATIFDDYKKQSHIKSEFERKKTVATRFKISVSSVEKAICLMGKLL